MITCSAASSPCELSSVTTIATGSPTKRTLSMASSPRVTIGLKGDATGCNSRSAAV